MSRSHVSIVGPVSLVAYTLATWKGDKKKIILEFIFYVSRLKLKILELSKVRWSSFENHRGKFWDNLAYEVIT